MRILGINETTHDAAVSVIEDGNILFAAHAERYSKQKNDWFTNDDLLLSALEFGKPDAIAYYEKPWLKKLRIKTMGGFGGSRPYYKEFLDPKIKTKTFKHHQSHAAAGYYTSRFNNAAIVVLDAIGEFETSTIWHGYGNDMRKVYSQSSISFGLFYSAFTELVGLKPNEEEYIMMGMAAYGNWKKYYKKVNSYFPKHDSQKYNFIKGIIDWGQPITEQDKFDIAASAQKVFEQRLIEFMKMAINLTGCHDLVFMGGCALNASANTLLWDLFANVWIMPNPGDAGSSLGAAAAMYGKHLNWKGPYLGYNLAGEYPVDDILQELVVNKIAAVASGPAEFGPRALGNRSILADPRDPNIKDKVNAIKKRELFRPFAPVVLEEHASHWFDIPATSPYMQYTFRCKQPEIIPSVVHHDGTSRVQTVNKDQHPGLYALLTKWYAITGVPVLLNTSLNIKGQPLLNDESDIIEWEKTYNTKIVR